MSRISLVFVNLPNKYLNKRHYKIFKNILWENENHGECNTVKLCKC